MFFRAGRAGLQRLQGVPMKSFKYARLYADATAAAATSAPAEDTLDTLEHDTKTGEIEKSRDEFVLYYSGVSIPSGQFSRFIPSWLLRRGTRQIVRSINRNLPPNLVETTSTIPRDNEGGIFVKYKLIDPTTDIRKASKEVIDATSGTRFLLGLLKREAFFVRGKPWIEDLKRTFTTQIRVTFDGPDLSPETLYHATRCYGRIIDIEPPSPASKDIPRSAIITFKRFMSACAARNCINRLKINDTQVYLSFVQVDYENPVAKWIVGHPRISVPIFIALFATLAYLIFEPLRFLSISNKAKGNLDFNNYPTLKWISGTYKSVSEYLWSWRTCSENTQPDNAGHVLSWGQIFEVKQDVLESLKEGASTFNVINGPKGSGKTRVVDLVLDSLGNNVPVIQLDCEELNKTKSDRAFLESLAHQLGYWPAFLWTNSVSRFVDLAATSLSGQNSGLSETAEQQANRMLSTAGSVIQSMALRHKNPDEYDADYLARNPEARPVVVIHGYRGDQGNNISKDIIQWAGGLVTSNLARVIIVKQDLSCDKALGEAMPNRVLRVNTLTDASVDVAKSYIVQMLKATMERRTSEDDIFDDTPEDSSEKHKLEDAISDVQNSSPKVLEPLGGRLSDLQNYIRRIVAGENPCTALEMMVDSSALEIEQMFLNSESANWSGEQVWVIMRKLAALKNPNKWLYVPLDISTDSLFAGESGLEALRELEYRELLNLESSGGEIHAIKAGKPLYYAAFCELMGNPVTWHIMEKRVLAARIKLENKKIASIEEELVKLKGMPSGWATRRQTYLSEKLNNSQLKIEQWEKESGAVLASMRKLAKN